MKKAIKAIATIALLMGIVALTADNLRLLPFFLTLGVCSGSIWTLKRLGTFENE